MKLLVLVPSPEAISSAGVRIRYQRMAPSLAVEGIELAVHDIAYADPIAADFDVLLISKCHDARSVVAASVASDRGKLVGVDLFDDYFSQAADPRLARYRAWLNQVLGNCSFALCSTEAMARTVRFIGPGLPVHVMNDPAAPLDLGKLAAMLAKKAAIARRSRRLGVVWFGVGDSPYFTVGLHDLAAWGGVLLELTRSFMMVELTIVTNRRALSADGLALIQALPVPVRIREWSELTEREVLDNALVAFLPVNAQPFTVAKSLNRAVTALSAGCQVLSAGYPLYSPLDPLIYREPAKLVEDLVQGSLLLSDRTLEHFREKVELLASAQVESRKLAAFLAEVSRPTTKHSGVLALIHGHSTRTDAHQFIRSHNGLSVSSPYCSAPLEFDVIFRGVGPKLEMLLSSSSWARLLPHARKRVRRTPRTGPISKERYFWLPGPGRKGAAPNLSREHTEPLPLQLATYAPVMSECVRRIADAFGPCRAIVSEMAPFPFDASDLAA
jgi:hypothetical protein